MSQVDLLKVRYDEALPAGIVEKREPFDISRQEPLSYWRLDDFPAALRRPCSDELAGAASRRTDEYARQRTRRLLISPGSKRLFKHAGSDRPFRQGRDGIEKPLRSCPELCVNVHRFGWQRRSSEPAPELPQTGLSSRGCRFGRPCIFMAGDEPPSS